jgi:hypothetical protein
LGACILKLLGNPWQLGLNEGDLDLGVGNIDFLTIVVFGNSNKLQKWFWKESLIKQVIHTWVNNTSYINHCDWTMRIN